MACSCVHECETPILNCLQWQDNNYKVSGVQIVVSESEAALKAAQGYKVQKHSCCTVYQCSCGSHIATHWHALAPGKPLPDFWEKFEEQPPPETDKPPILYDLDIPGLQDIIRIPALESPNLRRQQIARFKTHVTPIPEPLRWIPSVINLLDSAQDLLITVLYASRFLLKRLGPRLVPGLGWILTVNDAVNLTNALLGISMGGRSFKRASLKSLYWLVTRRAFRVNAAAEFLSRSFPWTSFILQAGQVSRDWTGYGLQLGSIMGFISEAVWSPFRMIQGDKVVFKAPPAADIFSKSGRILMMYPQHLYMQDILTPDEHLMIILAAFVAINVLREVESPLIYEQRAATVGEYSYPLWEPWNETSIKIMSDEGITFSDDPETGTLPYLPYKYAYQPVSQVIFDLGQRVAPWEDAMKDVLAGDQIGGMFAGIMHNLSWIDHINWANSTAIAPPPPPQYPSRRPRLYDYTDSILPIYEDFEIDAWHACEYSVFPTRPIQPDELIAWLSSARAKSLAKGFNHATFEDLQQAAIEVLGGFQRRRFETYTGSK